MSALGVQFENVSVRFGSQDVLRGVSLTIAPGETVAVIGESGCGKTVFLKLICGLLSPATGTVSVGDHPLAALDETALATLRRRFGFLFQNAALFDSLRVADNIAFGLRARSGYTHGEIQKQVAERLQDVGLPATTADKMPNELSGGMRKRVSLARALALDPDILLYDEPTTGLDPVMSAAIDELILKTKHRRPVTSVIVTHDLRTVAAVADRVIMLEPLRRLGTSDLQIIFDGPVDDLRDCSDERVRQFVRYGFSNVPSGKPATVS